MKYADYMKEEIFSPLGMNDTCIYHKGLLIENMVCGYEMDDESKIKRTERVSERILEAVYRTYYGDSKEKSDELSMDAGYIR